MKFDLYNTEKFSLEIPKQDGTEDTITGTIRELTKKEQKEFKSMFDTETKLAKDLNSLESKEK